MTTKLFRSSDWKNSIPQNVENIYVPKISYDFLNAAGVSLDYKAKSWSEKIGINTGLYSDSGFKAHLPIHVVLKQESISQEEVQNLETIIYNTLKSIVKDGIDIVEYFTTLKKESCVSTVLAFDIMSSKYWKHYIFHATEEKDSFYCIY